VQVPYGLPSAELKAANLTVVKKLSLDMPFLPMALDTNHIDYLLVDTGNTAWSALDDHLKHTLRDWIDEMPVLLAVPPDRQMISAVLDEWQPAGINLLIPDEIRPGVQEFEPVLDLLEALTERDMM